MAKLKIARPPVKKVAKKKFFAIEFQFPPRSLIAQEKWTRWSKHETHGDAFVVKKSLIAKYTTYKFRIVDENGCTIDDDVLYTSSHGKAVIAPPPKPNVP